MATTENEIPACVTHVARLESGILTGTWDREEFERYRDAERVNAQQYRPLAPEPLLASLFQGPAPEPFELAVRERDGSVSYGGTRTEEGCVGDEGVGTCRSGGWGLDYKK